VIESLQVFTTLPDEQQAGRLARELVERRLASCVQVVGPLTSTYRWHGSVESAREWLCLLKTTRDRYAELEAAVLELHPYDTPELVAVPLVAGSRRYLDWLASAVSPENDD
jgi:periplasmic divalent cation tolerance protein